MNSLPVIRTINNEIMNTDIDYSAYKNNVIQTGTVSSTNVNTSNIAVTTLATYSAAIETTSNDATIATTQFVKSAIDSVLGSSNLNTTLDTIYEIQQALGDDPNFSGTIIQRRFTNDEALINNTISKVLQNTTDISGNTASILLKADQSDLLTTNATVSSHTASINTINNTLSNKADQTDLFSTNATVSSNLSSINTINSTLLNKADQTDLLTTNDTVSSHTASINTINNTLLNKADQTDLFSTNTNIQDNYYTKTQVDQIKTDIYGGGVPSTTLDTISEIATALQTDQNSIGTILTSLTNKANTNDVYTKTQSAGLYQPILTFDTVPLSGSTNPITSGGTYSAVQTGNAYNINYPLHTGLKMYVIPGILVIPGTLAGNLSGNWSGSKYFIDSNTNAFNTIIAIWGVSCNGINTSANPQQPFSGGGTESTTNVIWAYDNKGVYSIWARNNSSQNANGYAVNVIAIGY